MIKYLKVTRIISTLLLLPVISVISVAADNPNSGRWYQVEMIVFKNKAVNDANPETFDITVQPSKPLSYETLTESQAQHISFLDLDFSLLSQKDLDIQQLINDESFTYEQAVQFFSSSHDVSTLLPKPYVLIDPLESGLSEAAQKLKGHRKMEVIAYQTWQQPIWDQAVASPIELNFGKQYDSQYEISGWLNLSISRYIHVNPQMYINQFQQLSNDEYQAMQFDKPQTFLKLDPNTVDAPKLVKPNPYRLVSSIEINETQRTASQQILYIDHPELAFLFYFTPIELATQ